MTFSSSSANVISPNTGYGTSPKAENNIWNRHDTRNNTDYQSPPIMSSAASQHYCLKWNNHHVNIISACEELYHNDAFTDVTLAAEDGSVIKCHKMVLAACSTYFRNIFMQTPCRHPVVVLKDIKYEEMKAILEYMYRGEVNIAYEDLDGLLKIAEVLKVKGLTEGALSSPPPIISTSTTSSAAQSTGRVSPPHSSNIYHPYGNSPIEQADPRALCASMWPLSGLPLPAHPLSGHEAVSRAHIPALAGSYNGADSSPLRKKKYSSMLVNPEQMPILRTVLGQGNADSSQGLALIHPDNTESIYRSPSNGSANDNDRRNSGELSQGESAHSPYDDANMDDDDKQSGKSANTSGNGQRPEWKRYKQYTRNDIMDAIEAVRGGMSALQAARKYRVPSRTLYDKVKKLGIRTSRPVRRNNSGSGARFPYGFGGNVNGDIYNGSHNLDQDNESPMDAALSLNNSTIVKEEDDELVMDMSRSSSVQRDEDEVEDLSVKKSENRSDKDD